MIHLGAIVDGLEMQSEDMRAYLNRQTGEVVTVSIADLSAAEEGDDLEGLADWEQEMRRQAIEILETDHYLQLPDQYEIHEWSIMQDFCNSLRDDRLRQQLLGNIHGKGAFRHFKETIYRHGSEEQWFDFRLHALQKIARRWLESHEIPFEDEAGGD